MNPNARKILLNFIVIIIAIIGIGIIEFVSYDYLNVSLPVNVLIAVIYAIIVLIVYHFSKNIHRK